MKLLLDMIPFYIEILEKYIVSNQPSTFSKIFLRLETELCLAKHAAAAELIDVLRTCLPTTNQSEASSESDAAEKKIWLMQLDSALTPFPSPVSDLEVVSISNKTSNSSIGDVPSRTGNSNGFLEHDIIAYQNTMVFVNEKIAEAITYCDSLSEGHGNHKKGSYDELLKTIQNNIKYILTREDEVFRSVTYFTYLEKRLASYTPPDSFIDRCRNKLLDSIQIYLCCLDFDRAIQSNPRLSASKKAVFSLKSGAHLRENNQLLTQGVGDTLSMLYKGIFEAPARSTKLRENIHQLELKLQFIKIYSEYSQFILQLESLKDVNPKLFDQISQGLQEIQDEYITRFNVEVGEFIEMTSHYKARKLKPFVLDNGDGYSSEGSSTPFTPKLYARF